MALNSVMVWYTIKFCGCRLNMDQAQTLHDAIALLPLLGESISRSKTCLVHGIFGSGKSFLIAVIILTFVKLAKLSSEQSPAVSILFFCREFMNLLFISLK